MKSHIEKPGESGVKVLRKLDVQSLSKSHSEFFWDYYVTDHDLTLNDLTYLLVVAKSTMIWRTSKAILIGRSTSQTFMDIENGNIGNLEKLSLPNGKGSTIVNSVDQMVKRKVKSVIVPCTISKESI